MSLVVQTLNCVIFADEMIILTVTNKAPKEIQRSGKTKKKCREKDK